jgi:hypothetical protein
MQSRKATLPGTIFVVFLYVLTVVSYVVFRAHFFAFCFGLAAVLASVALLKAQRPN